MVESLRNIQKDYEEYLLALQTEKKGIKKFLNKIDIIAKKNAELGIEVDAEALAKNKEEELLNTEIEITKVKTIIEEYEFKVDVYNKTIDYLKLAKDNLSLLYLDGLEKYFKEYAALLFKAKKPLVSIDKDLNISIYSKGFEHQLDYFSSGEIDGISLCLRLSLAKVLFKKEKQSELFQENQCFDSLLLCSNE